MLRGGKWFASTLSRIWHDLEQPWGCFLSRQKTGKSNVTDFVYENLELFEIDINEAACEQQLQRQKENESAACGSPTDSPPQPVGTQKEQLVITGVVYKNISPEENLAQCDPDKPGCCAQYLLNRFSNRAHEDLIVHSIPRLLVCFMEYAKRSMGK